MNDPDHQEKQMIVIFPMGGINISVRGQFGEELPCERASFSERFVSENILGNVSLNVFPFLHTKRYRVL